MFKQVIDHIFSHEPVYSSCVDFTLKYGMPVLIDNGPQHPMADKYEKAIEQITQRDIVEHYYTPIWNLCGVELIPVPLQALYYDCCVITAESEANRILQRIVGCMETGNLDVVTLTRLKQECEKSVDELKRKFSAELSHLYKSIENMMDQSERVYQSRLFSCYTII